MRGQPLTEDFRNAVRRAHHNIHTIKGTATLLGISRTAVRNALREQQRVRRHRRPFGLQAEEAVRQVIDDDPELYLAEIRDKVFEHTYINMSISTLHRVMRRLCFTRKKIDKHANERYTDYNIILRDEFLARISLIPKEDLFFCR